MIVNGRKTGQIRSNFAYVSNLRSFGTQLLKLCVLLKQSKKLFRMMMAQADLQGAIRSCMGSNRSGSFYWDIACLYRDFASTSLATHIKYQSIIQLDWLGRSCYEIYPKYRWTILESNYYPHDWKIQSQHCAIYSKLLKYPEPKLSHLAHQINVIIV